MITSILIAYALCYASLSIGIAVGGIVADEANNEKNTQPRDTKVSTIIQEPLIPSHIEDWDQRWKDSQ